MDRIKKNLSKTSPPGWNVPRGASESPGVPLPCHTVTPRGVDRRANPFFSAEIIVFTKRNVPAQTRRVAGGPQE